MNHVQVRTMGAPALDWLQKMPDGHMSGEVRVANNRSCYVDFGSMWLCLADISIGSGPVSLVVAFAEQGKILFENIEEGDEVFLSRNKCELRLGDWTCSYKHARVLNDALNVKCLSAFSAKVMLHNATDLSALANIHSALMTAVLATGTKKNESARQRVSSLTESLAVFFNSAIPLFELELAGKLANDTTSLEWPESTKDLLGAGTGLTPGSDDYLAGVLLVLRIAGAHRQAESLTEFLKRHWNQRTNRVSVALLEQASRGYAGESIIDVLDQLSLSDSFNPTVAALRLNQVGQSSGWDCFAGIYSALRVINVASFKTTTQEISLAYA